MGRKAAQAITQPIDGPSPLPPPILTIISTWCLRFRREMAGLRKCALMKRPSFQFYPGDWLRDPALRACSSAARGLWIDMICLLHEGQPYGHLTLNGKDILPPILARILGADVKDILTWLDELESVGAFSRTESGTIYSRRMVRDEEIRQARASGGVKSLQNPNVPRRKDRKIKEERISLDESFGGSPSSSSSSSSSNKNNNTSAEEVFEYWKSIHGHPRAILDAKRRRLINDRLKEGFTVESLKLAIDGCKASAWHQGENDRHQVFDDISLICRDAGKVEQFIGYQSEKARAETERKPERCPECLGAGKVPVRGLLNRAADGSRMEPCPACQKKAEVSDVGTGTLRLATA